jgi:hypothetical protein
VCSHCSLSLRNQHIPVVRLPHCSPSLVLLMLLVLLVLVLLVLFSL